MSRWLALTALVLLVACRDKPESRATTDAGAGKPPRVVSLSPATTETLFAIGAGDQVVGRSRYCTFPPEVTRLPQIGGFVDPSLEAILGLRPTLVVGSRGPAGSAITRSLEERGVAVYFPTTETFADIYGMIEGIGRLTDHAAEARARVATITARVAAIDAAASRASRPRVLLVFGLEPLVVAGPGSFADEMLRHAGADNAVREGGAYPTLGLERALTLDPDVVINAAMAEAHADERLRADSPGWSKVRAVAAGRVARLTDEAVLRPGPRIADGLETLARAIHPELDLGDAGAAPTSGDAKGASR